MREFLLIKILINWLEINMQAAIVWQFKSFNTKAFFYH